MNDRIIFEWLKNYFSFNKLILKRIIEKIIDFLLLKIIKLNNSINDIKPIKYSKIDCISFIQ